MTFNEREANKMSNNKWMLAIFLFFVAGIFMGNHEPEGLLFFAMGAWICFKSIRPE